MMKRLGQKTSERTKLMESLNTFVSLLVDELALAGRHGTAHSYRSSMKRLSRFTGNTQIPFSALTPCLLKRYEQHLLLEGCKRNTVSLYLRMLRSICNQASRRGIVQIPPGLFDDVFTGTDTSEKRAVSPSVIRSLHDADLSDYPLLEATRDCFLLSFYLRGIPFVDLIRLRKSDISKDILRYRRSKTDRLLTVSVEPCAWAILKKYASQVKGSPYLLPIITKEGYAGYRQYQSALRRYNHHLEQLSVRLGLKVKLTSYVARHSWATAAYHQGIPVSVISESLGHASEKVTYTYLASFDNRTLNRANRKVIALVTRNDKPCHELFGKRNFGRWNL